MLENSWEEPDYQKGQMLRDLGMAAAHLQGDDSRMTQVRDQLRGALGTEQTAAAAIDGMKHIKDQLTADDLTGTA